MRWRGIGAAEVEVLVSMLAIDQRKYYNEALKSARGFNVDNRPYQKASSAAHLLIF